MEPTCPKPKFAPSFIRSTGDWGECKIRYCPYQVKVLNHINVKTTPEEYELLHESYQANSSQLDLCGVNGDTALDVALASNNLSVVQRIIQIARLEGSNTINLANSQGKSPLQIAFEQGNDAMLSILIQAGANTNIPCPNEMKEKIREITKTLSLVQRAGMVARQQGVAIPQDYPAVLSRFVQEGPFI